MDERKLRQLLGSICEHCASDGYCILKEITIANGSTERFLVQCKCCEIFKFEESQRQGFDIGWKKAWDLWVELGYAAKFAKVYEENSELSYREIYIRSVKPRHL